MTIKQYINQCPNHFNGRKGNVPDMIVLHNTGGDKISSAHYWFLDKESETSAHFLVGLDGEVRQYVNIADGAWCNGTALDRVKPHFYGNASNGVVKSRSQNANLYTVSIEFVGNVGDRLNETQLETAVELIKYIRSEVEKIYGKQIPLNRLHIVGHYEIAPLPRSYWGKNIQYSGILEQLTAPPVDPYVPKPQTKPEENPKTSDFVPKKVLPLRKDRMNIIKE